MSDITLALLGDHEAAARLAKASRVVPCPYCNGTQVAIRDGLYTQIRCEKCGTRGPLADSAFEALIGWNTRAPILSESKLKKLEEIL